MTQVTLEEAVMRLPHLLHDAPNGEEIIITENSVPIARLIPIPEETLGTKPRPQFGSAKGLLQMADDFEAPLEDFKEYME